MESERQKRQEALDNEFKYRKESLDERMK